MNTEQLINDNLIAKMSRLHWLKLDQNTSGFLGLKLD